LHGQSTQDARLAELEKRCVDREELEKLKREANNWSRTLLTEKLCLVLDEFQLEPKDEKVTAFRFEPGDQLCRSNLDEHFSFAMPAHFGSAAP
jgi:hypothetical protein